MLMAQADEVKAFAREFVNGKGRTAERKRLIQAVYFQKTGERLRVNCITCYIEAIFKIIHFMEKQPCKYRLKKGALLSGFGDASKTCTNDNLTDELAEWHLQNTRGAASLFAVMPEPPEQDSNLEIVPIAKVHNMPVSEINTAAVPIVAIKKTNDRHKKRKK